MIIAELAIFPTSEGVSASRYVRAALTALEQTGLALRTGPMATCIEAPDLPTVFSAVTLAHQAVADLGPERIHIDLRIDDRRDKDATMAAKLRSLGKDDHA
jgi:uncharacterized protein (TIGR00106 family)